MKVQEIEIEKLKPYRRNTKKHSETQVRNVAESIRQYGFVQPIVIDENNEIVIGHCRAQAAQMLELETVPCVYAEGLTPAQINALRIVDNKSNESPWDYDFLQAELDEIDLDGFEFDFGLNDGIDWASVEDLSEQTYKEPEIDKLECPSCHHRDIKAHFKKI